MKIFSGKKPVILKGAEFLSARDLLQRAAAISVIFLLAHLAGFREYTGILAVIYIVFYLAFVVLAPVLVLAATILTVWRRRIQKAEDSHVTPNAKSRETGFAS